MMRLTTSGQWIMWFKCESCPYNLWFDRYKLRRQLLGMAHI